MSFYMPHLRFSVHQHDHKNGAEKIEPTIKPVLKGHHFWTVNMTTKDLKSKVAFVINSQNYSNQMALTQRVVSHCRGLSTQLLLYYIILRELCFTSKKLKGSLLFTAGHQ